MLGGHPVRHIVNDPIEHIFNAEFFQNVWRVERLPQARTEPPFRTFAGEGLDHVEAGGNQTLFTLGMVERFLMHAMPNEFPTCCVHGLCRARVGVNHTGVEAGRCRQATRMDGLDDARQTCTHAVVDPTEIGHIGNRLFAMRWGDDGARHAGFKLPVLHIHHQVNQDGAFFGRSQLGAFVREAVGYAWISHGCDVSG